MKSPAMTFELFIENAQAIFDSFPNERVWLQGGLRANRQLGKPEAGYCIVLRYDEKTTRAIEIFMRRVRSVLPPVVAYNQQNLHTTVGTYGKGNLQGFKPEPATLQRLMESVETGLSNQLHDLQIDFGGWFYNDETILISGYPNLELWQLCQNIGNTCQNNGFPLEMGRMMHVTTARFISNITGLEFDKFSNIMKTAPVIRTVTPSSIDLATWSCDGLKFNLVTHKRYLLKNLIP
jgi:hypothetical protein